MKTRNKVLIGLVLVAAALYGAAWYYYPWGSLHYKMTVVVDTPEGIETGSAVREIHFVSNPKIFPEVSRTSVGVKGEAVVVDLGDRGVLFAVISTNPEYQFYQAFPLPNNRGEGMPPSVRYYLRLKPGLKATLDPTKYPGYPQMVTFTDMNDPLSVKKVDKYDLSQAFGQGVALKEIILEVTDEPVTWGIEKYLPWLKGLKSNIDGSTATFSTNLSNVLHAGNFRKGIEND